MPTLLSHPAIPLAVGVGLGPRTIPRVLLVSGLAASILPDLDVVAFRLGVPYGNAFGHRGFSHALAVAGVLSLAGAWALRRARVPFRVSAAFLFLALASHGLLDTLTTGGKGIALLWPFSDARFFAPVQVIRVSPLGLSRFLSLRGAGVLASEALWVWLPSAGLALVLLALRAPRGRTVPFPLPPRSQPPVDP